MLPGKTYQPEDFMRIIRKRVWVILVPWAIIGASTAVFARMLPDMYKSTALIKYVPPQVPESIAKGSSGQNLQERLAQIQAAILSRPRLEELVREFDLYKEEQKTRIMDSIVASLRANIRTTPKKGDIFSVEYIGRDRQAVMKVTNRVADFFIEESLKDGARRAEGTADFVGGQVDDKKRELLAIEERLREYQLKFAGELPSQQGANVNAVNSLQNQLQQLGLALQQDKARQLFLEQAIADLDGQASPDSAVTSAPVTVPVDPNSLAGSAQQKLNQAKAALDQMVLKGYKPTHPQYQQWARTVRMLEKEVNEKSLATPVSSATAGLSPTEQNRIKQLTTYRNELAQLKDQIAQKEAQEKSIRPKILDYQAKADRSPYHEAQFREIQREYDVKNGAYNSFLSKRESANLNVDLQRRQIGEQFAIVDPALLPQTPYSPDRMFINLAGMVGGLVLGLAIVAVLEYRDTSFKTDGDLGRVLALPVLAVVPWMQSDAERRRRFRRRLILNLGLGSTVAVCLAVVAYTFVTMR